MSGHEKSTDNISISTKQAKLFQIYADPVKKKVAEISLKFIPKIFHIFQSTNIILRLLYD